MGVPFRIGVMQLTMEPLDEMLASARAMDEAGMDTVWLAEAYPWWRKHQMEARGSTVVSALMARETKHLTIGWGIISPYTRHPVQVAMDARVVQEATGPGRFVIGFGTSKIFLNNTKQGGPPKVTKPLGHMRDSVAIVRGVLGGGQFSYDGKLFQRGRPGSRRGGALAALGRPPVYVAGTAPLMQQLGGEIGNGLLTPSITTPAFVRYTRGNIETGAEKAGRPRRRRRSRLHDRRVDRCPRIATRGRDGAREIAGMYLANKVQNIQGSADVLLDLAEIEQDEIRPARRGDGAGGRLAAKAQVSDSLLDKCKPIAGTPSECIAAIEEYRDAGVHPHHARALGRRSPRADPPVRLESAAALPGLDVRGIASCPPPSTIDRDRLVDTASRMVGVHQLHGRRAGHGRAHGGAVRRDGPAHASGSRSRTAARTRSGSSKAPEAGRASCSTGTWTRPTRGARRGYETCPGSSPRRSSAMDGCTASASRT